MFLYNFLALYEKNGIIKGNYINNNKKYKSRGEINMKKTNLVKIISILLISVVVMSLATAVYAANENDTGYNDLTNTLTNNTANNTNKTNNTNNSSIYNSTNLPKTGIGDSIPVAMLVVIFGISAVYAYKKIKEYKNI